MVHKSKLTMSETRRRCTFLCLQDFKLESEGFTLRNMKLEETWARTAFFDTDSRGHGLFRDALEDIFKEL